MALILIVDDDARLRDSFARLLAQEGHQPITAASGEEGIRRLEADQPDMVVMDVRMQGISGIEALGSMKKADSTTPVIIMTAFGDTDTAIEAVNKGAFDYILKPFDIPEMLGLIAQALEASHRAKGEPAGGVPPEAPSVTLVGQSRTMREVYKQLGRVSATDATVLVQGESGTGKELAARAIWSYSPRKAKPFVVVNCVAIPETLLESELFGHEKGAFTGAGQRRAGKIELARGGTVFLDEIGDMPLSIQAKLLRLLQEKQIERLGGGGTIPVDVRIIAATNRDLEAAIASGAFREDLYYRLKVVTITLPPLGQRKEDIPQLAAHFLNLHAAGMHMASPGFTPEGLRELMEYGWPGNVRELSNVVQKTLIFSRGLAIGVGDVQAAIAGKGAEAAAPAGGTLEEHVHQALRAGGPDLFAQVTDHFAGLVLAEALRITGGNRSQAARLLGLSRPTLLAKMDKLGLTVGADVRVGDVLS